MAHFSLRLVILISSVAFIAETEAKHHRRHANSAAEREFLHRKNELKNNWSCNVPKKTLVYLLDERPDLRTVLNVKWYPPAVVVHRCSHTSGCCDNYPDNQCQAIASEAVEVVFQRIPKARSRNRQQPSYERFSFRNHTRCACELVT